MESFVFSGSVPRGVVEGSILFDCIRAKCGNGYAKARLAVFMSTDLVRQVYVPLNTNDRERALDAFRDRVVHKFVDEESPCYASLDDVPDPEGLYVGINCGSDWVIGVCDGRGEYLTA